MKFYILIFTLFMMHACSSHINVYEQDIEEDEERLKNKIEYLSTDSQIYIKTWGNDKIAISNVSFSNDSLIFSTKQDPLKLPIFINHKNQKYSCSLNDIVLIQTGNETQGAIKGAGVGFLGGLVAGTVKNKLLQDPTNESENFLNSITLGLGIGGAVIGGSLGYIKYKTHNYIVKKTALEKKSTAYKGAISELSEINPALITLQDSNRFMAQSIYFYGDSLTFKAVSTPPYTLENFLFREPDIYKIPETIISSIRADNENKGALLGALSGFVSGAAFGYLMGSLSEESSEDPFPTGFISIAVSAISGMAGALVGIPIGLNNPVESTYYFPKIPETDPAHFSTRHGFIFEKQHNNK